MNIEFERLANDFIRNVYFLLTLNRFDYCGSLSQTQLDGIMHKWTNPHFDDF